MSAETAQYGNMLAKQIKKQHEDSQYVFPKIPQLTRDMILQHQVDDTYNKSSYMVDYVSIDVNPGANRACSSRRNRPHPSKNFLSWRHPPRRAHRLNPTDDSGLFKWCKKENYNMDQDRPDSTLYETETAKWQKDVTCSPIQRHRLLNREEISKTVLPDLKESHQELASPKQSAQAGGESYSDLNKFFSNDAWKDKEVLSEALETDDKRYLIKLLHALTPETLMGLKKWLLDREEEPESEDGDWARCPPISLPSQRFQNREDFDVNSCSPPPTPAKDQENVAYEQTVPLCFEKDDKHSFPKRFETAQQEDIRKSFDSGDSKYIEKLLNKVIRPEAIKGIEQWLIIHTGKDREVALRFLGQIRTPSSRQEERGSESGVESPLGGQLFGKVKTRKKTPHGKNCSCAVCDAEHSNKILRALYKQGNTAIIDEMRKALESVPRPKRMVTRKQTQRKNQVSRLGGDNLGRNTNTYQGYVANKGALFMQPHRILPSYFVIHPEFTELPYRK